MIDPFGSFQNMMSQYQAFQRNPIQFLASRGMNVPQGATPQQIIQQAMNNGQLSQQQFNQLRNMAEQIQNNPDFNKFR